MPKGKHVKLSTEETLELINFYLQPNTLTATAKKFNLHRHSVDLILKKNNIKLHDNATLDELRKQTCLTIYGVDVVSKSIKVLDKMKQTNLIKYGAECTLHSEQTKQYLTTKFGCQHSPKHRYVLDISNIKYYFDSFVELCFYLYHIKNNITIKRESKEFEYIFKNIKHKYYPDFEVNGQLIEIKGNHFLNEDGTWQNPFDHSQDALYEAKHQCAIANNVKILYNDDYQKYIDWFYKTGYKKEDFEITKIENN